MLLPDPSASSLGWMVDCVSVLMIVAGLLGIVLQVAGIAVDVLVAWVLLVSGGAHLVFAWHTRMRGGVTWQMLLGVVYIGTGFYLLVWPVAGLASLTLALAIYLFAEGVLEFLLSRRPRTTPIARRGLAVGIVTFTLAAMIWSTWPWNTVWVIGTLVDISIFFSGITRLMLSLAPTEGDRVIAWPDAGTQHVKAGDGCRTRALLEYPATWRRRPVIG